jgi:hypothetical protein
MRLRLLVGIRFQVSFTPLSGVLFTFPSRYWFTIGHQGVFRLGGWSPHVQTGFHVSRLTHGSTQTLRIRGCHPLRPDFPVRSAYPMSTTGLFRFRSPLLTESRLMSVPPGTEMFQFPGFASQHYGFMSRYPSRGGLPHSDIHGSTPARGSPWLIAACHVLHRLLVPRHPPNALLLLNAPPRAGAREASHRDNARRPVHHAQKPSSVRHARHRASPSATALRPPHRDSFPHTDLSLSTQLHSPLNATPWQQGQPVPSQEQTTRSDTPPRHAQKRTRT